LTNISVPNCDNYKSIDTVIASKVRNNVPKQIE
jgi:hypothetical protein